MTTLIIHSSTLKGHLEAVLCLYHTNNALWSGSEDQTARLWDHQRCHGRQASLCLKAPGSVYSIVTGDAIMDETIDNDSNNVEQKSSLSESFARDYIVYLAVEQQVHAYDLRHSRLPIMSSPTETINDLSSADEINQLALWIGNNTNVMNKSSIKGKKKNRQSQGKPQSGINNNSPKQQQQILATADDLGFVRIFNLHLQQQSTKKPPLQQSTTTTTKLLHDENAMVTSIAFAPRAKSFQHLILASGGTDNCVQLWNVAQQDRIASIDMTVLQQHDDNASSSTPLCNPPMVHTLSWSPSGRLLAAGLGDGSLAIIDGSNNKSRLLARVPDAHNGPVACVDFYCSNSNAAITAHDRCLVSAGNDGHVVWWDLGKVIAGNAAIDPQIYFVNDNESSVDDVEINKLNIDDKNQGKHTKKKNNNSNKHRSKSNDKNNDDIRNNTDLLAQPTTLGAVVHGHKPNYMVASRPTNNSTSETSTIFIADTTNDITAYTLPI